MGYGQAGRATCNFVPAPANYASDNTACLTQDIDAANALLDEAGYMDTDGNGVRETPDGQPISLLYQTATNAVRQDFQALIKQWWSEIGIETELRNIDAGVYFGADPGSPDTLQRFYADVEMHASQFPGTDPQAYLGRYLCDKIPSPETQWQGENTNRVCMDEYEALWNELTRTADFEERGRIARELNDMVTKDSKIIIPLVHRGYVSAHANSLGGVGMNPWDSELWNIADWNRMPE